MLLMEILFYLNHLNLNMQATGIHGFVDALE